MLLPRVLWLTWDLIYRKLGLCSSSHLPAALFLSLLLLLLLLFLETLCFFSKCQCHDLLKSGHKQVDFDVKMWLKVRRVSLHNEYQCGQTSCLVAHVCQEGKYLVTILPPFTSQQTLLVVVGSGILNKYFYYLQWKIYHIGSICITKAFSGISKYSIYES